MVIGEFVSFHENQLIDLVQLCMLKVTYHFDQQYEKSCLTKSATY